MTVEIEIIQTDDQYVLNHCTKHLARKNTKVRHNFRLDQNDDRQDDELPARICEAWRFPIIDSYNNGVDSDKRYKFNVVTFVYQQQEETPQKKVAVIGTFAALYEPISLTPVSFMGEPTGYYALSVVVPKGQMHFYKFIVDGQVITDPINPQSVVLENNKSWSRFFTNLCTEPLNFEQWEFEILSRLVDHILPFHTKEGENFLKRFRYDNLSKQDKDVQYAYAYHLDESVGAVNFIDNLLAREERHHLIDYKICLEQINLILRQRNPYIEPKDMQKKMYVELYEEMAADNVNGWDKQQYNSPLYFLQLLRRHTYTGAFSHPKYGGNVGAAGWAYLDERYRDKGSTFFNWRRAIEQPLGTNSDYLG